jgi:hypothetical protein
LRQQRKQINSQTHSPWRAWGRGLLFTLLLTQQVWANLYNCCEPLPETSAAESQTAVPACHAAMATPAISARATKPAHAPAQTVICCPMPDSATEGVALLTPNQTLIPNPLPPLVSQVLAMPTVAARDHTPAPLQRPLYLALSCWLI